MFFIAAWVMWAKAQYLSVAAKANGVFMTRFRRMTGDLTPIDSVDAQERAIMAKAPLYRIYETGMDELDQRPRRWAAVLCRPRRLKRCGQGSMPNRATRMRRWNA